MKTVDFAVGAVSESGLYRAEVVQIEASTLMGVPVARSAIRLKWYVLAGGASWLRRSQRGDCQHPGDRTPQ